MRNDQLDYRFPDRLRFSEHRDSPIVSADEPGVALAVGELVRGEQSISVLLHVTLGLEAEFFHAYKRAVHAIVVTAEELGAARAAAIRLVDPDVDYLRPMWPNFDTSWTPPPDDDNSASVFMRGWVSAPIQLRVTPTSGHRGVWLQAHFRHFHSERVHLGLG
jgi:hypothetical protein